MLLGSRTKQINSYGKRSRRVVDAAPLIERSTTDSKLISIFDDLPPAPVWTSVASKMKKREVATKQKPLSLKVVRKKRISPVLSAIKKRKTGSVARVISIESCKPPDSPAGQSIRTAVPTPILDSHPRVPFSSFCLNVPGSPAVPQKLAKSHFVPRPAPAYSLVPSPIPKTRQLTPIRGGRNKRLFDPPSPPSPTTLTDFDLSMEFSDFSLESPSQTQDTYRSEFEVPTYLKPLLEECHQETCGPHNFSAFIESFPFDPITSRGGIEDVDLTFRKIGEASYSEVFGIGDVVLKVIPIRDESEAGQSITPEEEDGPAPSDAKDVRKEIIVTRAMGEVYNGFVKLLKNYVVRGRYPEVLLQLWDEYNERKGSESVRPGKDNLL